MECKRSSGFCHRLAKMSKQKVIGRYVTDEVVTVTTSVESVVVVVTKLVIVVVAGFMPRKLVQNASARLALRIPIARSTSTALHIPVQLE